MRSSLYGKDLLSLADLSSEQLTELLDTALRIKRDTKAGRVSAPLSGKSVAIIMQKASIRTRVSFEVATARLGAHPVVMTGQNGAFSRGEPVNDTARVLDGYVDCIVLRTYADSLIEELAHHARVPVVNALTDKFHPCQGLADLLTVRERFGSFAGLKLVYIGDGSNNMAHTYLQAGALVGMDVAIATPDDYRPDADILAAAHVIASGTGAHLTVTSDVYEAAEAADVIVTDTFTSMGQEDEHDLRLNIFKAYRVDDSLMERASARAIFMHCLPAHRGEEVTSEVIDGPQSVIYAQAENRVHAQQALLSLLLNERNE
ncbi:MAG: ornithine carbamoyltransferase [Coriobacteriia bacterium]|nr:ornithine carbamoyltransferase [Coriobacteriia bacterium]